MYFKALLLGSYIFRIFVCLFSDDLIDPFVITKCLYLTLVLYYTLTDINTVISFLMLTFSVVFLFPSLCFKFVCIFTSLYLKYAPYKQHLVRYCFFLPFYNLCFIGMFSPFTFIVIIDTIGFSLLSFDFFCPSDFCSDLSFSAFVRISQIFFKYSSLSHLLAF